MDDFELISAIWEVLAQAKTAQDVDYIMLETGAEPAPVRTALAKLRNAHLIDIAQQTPRLYTARVMLSAMEWAQAVSLGVSLSVLECHGKLQARERQQALQLAASGAVEQHAKEQQNQRHEVHQQARLSRAKSQAAATELGQLVNDARRSLEAKRTAQVDPTTLWLLEQLVKESESSLGVLEKSLMRA